MHTTTKSYNDLKKELDALYASSPTDTANAIDALICNLKYDKKSKKEDATKVDGKNTDVIAVAGKELTSTDNRAELTQVFTLDRARFITKRGELKPEKLTEVLTQFKKLYQLPNTSEVVELDAGFDEE